MTLREKLERMRAQLAEVSANPEQEPVWALIDVALAALLPWDDSELYQSLEELQTALERLDRVME